MKLSAAKYTLLTIFSLALLGTSSCIYAAAPPPQDADATLRIVNESEQTICSVYITPVTSDEWGDDWLGDDETIPAGESCSFDLPSGQYNVLLGDCEGNVLLVEGNITVSELHELRFNTCRVRMGILHYAQYPEALRKLQARMR